MNVPDLNEILWITQMRGVDDIEIITLNVAHGTWERLHRIFKDSIDELNQGDVLITLKLSDNDLADDDPLIIKYHHALWLFKDFWKLPAEMIERLNEPMQ